MASHSFGSTGDDSFESTDWGLIAVARSEDALAARRALADLCGAYWYPLYVYIRRHGYSADRAQDLTQGFFASLLESDFLDALDPGKGRFRAFLLASLKNFLANQRDRDEALKRGGGCLLLSIDRHDAEGRYALEPSHELTAERLYERRWAMTLLGRVLDRLGNEMVEDGKGPLFDLLRPALLGEGKVSAYRRVAEELATTEDAIKMAALRLRRRYRELVHQEVARTVGGRGDIEDEIRDLLAALGP